MFVAGCSGLSLEKKYMFLKFIFDRIVSFTGLLFLWPILLIVAILVKVKMPGGPAFFIQKRVGKDDKLFNCHKFCTMTAKDEDGILISETIKSAIG